MVQSTKKTSKATGKTQAQRRAETTQKLLRCATQVFADKGYQNTSVEDIAQHGGLTIRPIYHYFGNKKQLFEAVVEQQESQLTEELNHHLQKMLQKKQNPSIEEGWKIFLLMAKNPHFRQTVLIDAPNILGRERWNQCAVSTQVQLWIGHIFSNSSALQQEIISRILFSALAEIAMLITHHEQADQIEFEIQQLLSSLLPEN